MTNKTRTDRSDTDDDNKMIATIPYLKGTSERITRISRPDNITVAYKPSTTLRDLLTKIKDPSPTNSRTGAVYKIPYNTISERLGEYWSPESKNASAPGLVENAGTG